MKKLLALLLLFGIVGCATNTPLILESRISGESYNSWDYYTYDDDFDGKYRVSKVTSNSGGLISIFTPDRVNNSSFQYKNGDSYICSVSGGLYTQMIFTKNDGSLYKHEVYLSLSSNNSVLYADSLGGNRNQLIPLLNFYDNLKIRTTDNCGTKIDHIFNISGTTHLKPYENF